MTRVIPSEVSRGDERLNGTTEVHVAWMVALKLRADLEARGITVCMTKDKQDTLVRNRDRAEIANRAGALLLVRLHCDTGRDSGFVVYYPDREGTAEGKTGPSAAVRAASDGAAITIHAAMAEALAGLSPRRRHPRRLQDYIGSKQGALTGLDFLEVPVVTVEMVVLSHSEDARFIESDSGVALMANAIATGVAQFVASARADATS